MPQDGPKPVDTKLLEYLRVAGFAALLFGIGGILMPHFGVSVGFIYTGFAVLLLDVIFAKGIARTTRIIYTAFWAVACAVFTFVAFVPTELQVLAIGEPENLISEETIIGDIEIGRA